ncbi:MAG: hypothetical protein JO299_09060 [Gammaproteobacteria bacterium]|nr:hypothetical protein [Gammaproteobacteria bacterium]
MIMLGTLGTFMCIAVADPLKPGDALTYTMTTSWSEAPEVTSRKRASDSAEPPDRWLMRSTSITFIVKVDRLDADGSAHASIPVSNNNKRVTGWSGSAVDVNVMPDGQIVPKVDFAMIQAAGFDQTTNEPVFPPGYRPRTPAEWSNIQAFLTSRKLLLFNEVALGAGKKKTFKEGDAWRIVIPDQNNQVVNFVCQGTQQFQGRDVAVLALTTTRMTQNGVGPVGGTAFYDVQNHLLVKLHMVGDNDTVTGVHNQTIDIILQ